MDPHPDQAEQPETRSDSRAGAIVAVVVAGVLLIIVVLHVVGVMSLHSS
jgi:hypothetical protein